MKNWWTRCLCLLVVVTTMIPATGCAKKKITVKMPEDISITEEDVCLEDGALVVKNQLLLVTNPDTNYKRVEKMVRSAGGEIIGYISFSGDYQISFPEEKNAEQLQQIMEIWSTEEFVESVSCNQVSVMEEASVDYTNDSWLDNSDDAKWPQNTLWDEENPGGMNWWAEAIGMPSVWAMDGWENLKRDPVKIGVFDTVFAEQHEDLDQVIVKTWQNNTVDVDSRDHGSHVSGLIAAEVGNGVGIAGVASCVKPELYCFAAAGNADHTYTSLMIYKYAMALMFQEGVKLINISMGPANATVFAAQKENRQARDFITDGNAELARFLRKALDAGYEFLIVKSAGNTSGYEFVKCDVSKEAPYGYRLAKEGDKKKARLSQSCSAEYTWFAAIDDPAVRERVLIVGAAGLGDASAAKSGKKYTPAYFSNYGCDLYAPGVDILSLGYGEQTTELMDGTSMSTPIVSGIAGLVWHINPDLSGKHVADIVRASTDKTVSDPTAGFANAAAAVELAK